MCHTLKSWLPPSCMQWSAETEPHISLNSDLPFPITSYHHTSHIRLPQMSTAPPNSRGHREAVPPAVLQDGDVRPRHGQPRLLRQERPPLRLCPRCKRPQAACIRQQVRNCGMIDDGNGVVLPPLLMILPIAGSRGRCRSQGRRIGSVQTAWTRREAC